MYRKIFKNLVPFCFIWLILFSCKKDKPITIFHSLPKDTTNLVLIVNEGSLGNGNAELGVYHPGSGDFFPSVFETANGQKLGDVFQSAVKIRSEYFLCINNSDKIIVVDPISWLQKASINVNKPRYILDLGNNRAYVGSLFSNKIFIINTLNHSVIGSIQMPFQNVESMMLKNEKVYVSCWDTACKYLYIINPKVDAIIDSISLLYASPQAIVVDKDQNLWVMGGNTFKGVNSNINVINPATQKVIRSYSFSKGIEAIKPVFNNSRDTLYFLEVNYNGGSINNGVFRMQYQSSSLPSNAWLSCQINQYFWALGIDPNSGLIFVGDPKGFVQKSSVTIFNSEAKLQKQFLTGIGIGSFYFD
jgi:hypothetical protein